MITIYKLINNIGNIFSSWDAVVSWNRWATDFFHNEIPSRTWHYPQLLPANWSLSYVILDYPFQFIARGIMPLFSFFMLLILFAYGVKSKSIYPFFALILLYILTVDRGGFTWTDGYADVPLAFFSTITLISVVSAETKSDEDSTTMNLILGIFFACGAAITKQAGIFLLITLPGFIYYYFKKNRNWGSKIYLKFLIIYIILLFIVVLPFYLYTEINIIRGIEDSEISWVTDGIFRGATYSQRFSNAIDIFSDLFGSKMLFMVFTIFWIISFLRIVLFRSLAIFITIPFFIIWALFYSYDIRNSILLIPFYCCGVGGGFEYLIKNLLANFQKKNELQIP